MATPRREAIAQLQQRIATLHGNRERLELQIALQGGEQTAPIALLNQRDEAVSALAQAEAELARLQAGPSAERAPYLGLDTFGERDADLFHGREALVRLLVEKVRGESLVAVFGPSGSGKSSVVLAGLIPALRAGDLAGSDAWRYVLLKPGARPLDALAAALSKANNGDLGAALALRDALSKDRSALLVAAEMMGATANGPRLVIVVDQCEELWTQLPGDPDARASFVRDQQMPFIELLLRAVTAPATPVLVILTMRADFLHRAAEIRDLANVVSSRIIVVSPMQPDELRAAIALPAAAVGGDFEEGLVGALVEQVQGRPGALPLLEYTLLELWKARGPDGTMTWEAFRALGGVEGALAARADALIAQHYNTPQRLAELRALLLRLVQPGEGAGDTRRRVALADLAPADGAPEQVQLFLKPMIDERLLTTGRDEATREETVEVSHEALIRSWPTLSGWISKARDDLRLQLQLEDAARQWQANSENPSFLWSGVRLANAGVWLGRARPTLNARDKRFLVASRAREKDEAAEKEAQRQRELELAQGAQREAEAHAASDRRSLRRLVGLTAVLVVAVIAASVLGFIALSASNNASKTAHEAKAQALAANALIELGQNPELSLLLATEAVSATRSFGEGVVPVAQDVLSEALQNVRAYRTLTGPHGPISRISYSPSGQLIAVGSEAGIIDVLDTVTFAPRGTVPGRLDLVGAVWSPDESSLLVYDPNDSVSFTDIATGRQRFVGQPNTPIAGYFPTNNTLLVVGASGEAELRDLSSGKVLNVFPDAPINNVSRISWRPDGKAFMVADLGTVTAWDTSTRKLLFKLGTDEAPVYYGRWNRSGSKLLTLSGQTVQVRNAANGEIESTIPIQNSQLTTIMSSPDDRFVLTAGFNTTPTLWRIETGQAVAVLAGNSGDAITVDWSPDGRSIITGSDDGTIRIWTIDGDDYLNPGTLALSTRNALYSPDGRSILTSNSDGTGAVWNAATGELRFPFGDAEHKVDDAAWSADGHLILSSGQYVWRASDGALLRTFNAQSIFSPDGSLVLEYPDTPNGATARRIRKTGDDASVPAAEPSLPYFSTDFSPDSRFFLLSEDPGYSVWRADNQQKYCSLEHSENTPRWSPTTQMLAATEKQGVRLWDTQANCASRLISDTLEFSALAFSPDGRVLAATAKRSPIVKLWDVATGKPLPTLMGHTGAINSVAFSRDGRWIVTASKDKTARVWDVASGKTLHILRVSASIPNSAAFDPAMRHVLTVNQDNRLQQFPLDLDELLALAPKRITRQLTPEERKQFNLAQP